MEALIAMMVLGMTVTAVYSALMTGLRTVRLTREQQRASQILLDTVEMIRLYSWEQLTDTPGFVPASFVVKDSGPVSESTTPTTGKGAVIRTGVTYYGQITLSDPKLGMNYDSRLMQVKVDLVWRSEGMERRRELTTLVAFGGLYSFIY